jgi:hypothetical protein
VGPGLAAHSPFVVLDWACQVMREPKSQACGLAVGGAIPSGSPMLFSSHFAGPYHTQVLCGGCLCRGQALSHWPTGDALPEPPSLGPWDRLWP